MSTGPALESDLGVGPSRLRVFAAWLACFYTAWLLLVSAGGLWEVALAHWPIATSMAIGSYFAGSTPMGGGTVGFPVLVLLFDHPASIGRDFAFAVQSVGMTSASIYILASRQRVDWAALRVALPTSALVTPLACVALAPHVPSRVASLVFGVVVASFGLVHLARITDVSRCSELAAPPRDARVIGLVAGVAGGVVASMIGVGIDMLIYIGLVAYARVDLRIAIPTSVILMAFTSLVGIATQSALAQVEPEVFGSWLAAAPVVAIGAPFGSVVVTWISRTKTLIVTSLLCVIQLVWSLVQQRVVGATLVLTLAALALLVGGFHALFVLGRRRYEAARRGPAVAPAA